MRIKKAKEWRARFLVARFKGAPGLCRWTFLRRMDILKKKDVLVFCWHVAHPVQRRQRDPAWKKDGPSAIRAVKNGARNCIVPGPRAVPRARASVRLFCVREESTRRATTAQPHRNKPAFFFLKKKRKDGGRRPESNRGLLHPKQEFYHLTTAPPVETPSVQLSRRCPIYACHCRLFLVLL